VPSGRFILCLALAGLAPVSGRAAESAPEPPRAPEPACSKVPGIDVSKYQGAIRWPAVQQAGVRFVFVRVSDGIDVLDERFAENWAGARAAGLLRGAYQYFRPSVDALAQARLFMNTVGRLRPGDLPPVLDVETLDDLSAKTVVAAIRTWLDHVAKHSGRTPILYTNTSTWTALGAPDLGARPLWIAKWGNDCPAPLPGFTQWHFWQQSSTGKLPGIDGAVDLDWYSGTIEELGQLAGVKPPKKRSTQR
jgi:lysozyme